MKTMCLNHSGFSTFSQHWPPLWTPTWGRHWTPRYDDEPRRSKKNGESHASEMAKIPPDLILNGSYMVNIWLIYGKYMVNIWLMTYILISSKSRFGAALKTHGEKHRTAQLTSTYCRVSMAMVNDWQNLSALIRRASMGCHGVGAHVIILLESDEHCWSIRIIFENYGSWS